MGILDYLGRAVRKPILTRAIAAPDRRARRAPFFSDAPADGLTPDKLAGILRAADRGDGHDFLELAETIEERDLHYAGVLGARKRAVAQIEISVDAADSTPEAEKQAAMIRKWLMRDELASEIFNILDALGKGYSVTEIIWDISEGQYYPARLEWRDPRWFCVDRNDLQTLMLKRAGSQPEALAAFKFITAHMPSKSGLPLRSGLARVAIWAWMFKAFTNRDWTIFSQTYGMPIRLGRYDGNTTADDKDTLLRAVRNIIGDGAAIVPHSMEMEFIQPKNLSATGQLYRERCEWLDKQMSKAILGQTSTTDAVVGGLGSGKEHREVQKDIEAADARALSAILNRDLVRPWIDLEFGQQKAYPRLKIIREREEDLAMLSSALAPLIDRGLAVDAKSIRDRFGLKEPEKGADILRPVQAGGSSSDALEQNRKIKNFSGEIKKATPALRGNSAEIHQSRSAGLTAPLAKIENLKEELAALLGQEAAPILEQLRDMAGAAGSLEELREMLLIALPDLRRTDLAESFGDALALAQAHGMVDIGVSNG